MNVPLYIGEIIESSTIEFIAESRELHSPPRFGSFVKADLFSSESNEQTSISTGIEEPIEDPFATNAIKPSSGYSQMQEDLPVRISPAIFGVVYHASTTNTDTTRRRAYWKEEEQLKEEQPELSEWLLMTEFRAIVVGYSENGRIRWHLPPHPPRIHSFVYPCTTDDIYVLTSRFDFLRTLANFRNAPTEEILAACIREAAQVYEDRATEFKAKAAKELARLMRDDYELLQAVIRRFES